VVSGDTGGNIQTEVHGCRCMQQAASGTAERANVECRCMQQAASGTAERANVECCPAVRKVRSLYRWRLDRERMTLTRGDVDSIGADTMGQRGASAPPLLICRGHGGHR